MNTNDSNLLIDESEIRAALSFIGIDRETFGHGVRERVQQRVEQARVRPASTDDANLKDHGGFLRIAGSVLPVNLLGANTAAAPTSLASAGVFQKAIAFLAFPAISFLMIAVTIGSWFRIKAAQKSQSLPEADMDRIQESVTGWWRRYGWIAAIVFVLTLAAPFMSWTTPLLLLLMVSAIGTASLITTLGRAGLVDRNIIGGYCAAMLGLLGQASIGSVISNKTQLVDPHLVTITLFAGAAFLSFFINPFALPRLKVKPKRSERSIFLALAGFHCLFALFLLWIGVRSYLLIFIALVAPVALGLMRWACTRWPASGIVVHRLLLVSMVAVVAFILLGHKKRPKPITTSTLVQYAETFDPERVGAWSDWQPTARWLRDQGISYDQSAVQARWLDSLNRAEILRPFVLNYALSTGLKFPSELSETEEFKATVQRLLSEKSAGTLISSVNHYEHVFAVLAEEGTLTSEQRDHLAGRLLASWRLLHDDRFRSLVDASIITNMFSLIDHPLAESERKSDVERWLGEFQVRKSRPFSRPGGFKIYSSLNSSDLIATDHAVRLMQHYGTHKNVDIVALQEYLQPDPKGRELTMKACIRFATRQRLEQVPGIQIQRIPQPGLWDYIRLNQSLWFAMLLVGLCVYATLGSPRILTEENDRK